MAEEVPEFERVHNDLKKTVGFQQQTPTLAIYHSRSSKN